VKARIRSRRTAKRMSRALKRKGAKTVRRKKMMSKSGEVWRVTVNGKPRRMTTRRRSLRAMDEALILYGPALERLANR
jgi:hypothetical protein